MADKIGWEGITSLATIAALVGTWIIQTITGARKKGAQEERMSSHEERITKLETRDDKVIAMSENIKNIAEGQKEIRQLLWEHLKGGSAQ